MMAQNETAPVPAGGPATWMPVPARILHIKDENFNTYSIRLRTEDEIARNGYRWAPGQFNMLYAPGVGEIEERQVSYSTALFSAIKGRGDYLVGPLARLNLNHEKLHPVAIDLLKKVCSALKEDLPWNSSFLSLPAQAVETVHALALAADILQSYGMPSRCRIPIRPQAGYGGHGTETPEASFGMIVVGSHMARVEMGYAMTEAVRRSVSAAAGVIREHARVREADPDD